MERFTLLPDLVFIAMSLSLTLGPDLVLLWT